MIFSLKNWCIPVIGGFLSAVASVAAHAQTFEQAVSAARKTDAQYTTQQAAVQGLRAQAGQASTIFFPYAGMSYNRSDLSQGGVTTRVVSVTQPLISYDRYLTLKQSDPLVAQADAQEKQADNDLVLRVFTAMAEIVRNRESIRAMGVQIAGLQEQLNRALRMRELGQGTVTEVSDFDARLAIAQANQVSVKNTLQVAERNFTMLTGLHADVASLSVEPTAPWQDERSFDELLVKARDIAPSIKTARSILDQAEIASQRLKAQYLPQVSAQAVRAEYSGRPTTVSNVSITLSAMLGAASYYDEKKASAEIYRAQENLRYADELMVTELTRVFVAVRSYRDEVAIRQRAVQAAKVAVDANVKSYQGGIKTNSDVLTSYQNLADTEMALVTARLAQNEAGLRLKLIIDQLI
jgi:protease secretion system outer membrane protein